MKPLNNNTLQPDIKKKNKAVAVWLLIGVGMIMIQVLLGGVTRLTGSGLSITEWKPIMGFLPPTSHTEWEKAFAGYQKIAQYKFINNHFTLSDFKFIYFWEWFHRVWARLLGVVFAIPFVYFLIKKYFHKQMVIPLVILFILGGAQGLIGWKMVSSGLNDTNLYVVYYKLAIHFISALILLCYTLWFALSLLIPKEQCIVNKPLHNYLIATITLLTLQLIYGAFMAGLHAATAAPTWPTINGSWIPDTLWQHSWLNFPINVHFVHRTLAYTLLVVIIISFIKFNRAAKRSASSSIKKYKNLPVILVGVQVLLGIFTVLSSPKIVLGHFGLFETLAEAHQLVAMCLLVSLVIQLYLVKKTATS